MQSQDDESRDENARAELRAAWDRMIAELARAREAIDDPALYPPPPTGRNLAEGYRYLLGFVYGAIERAFGDAAYPYFRRAIQPIDKATIDNPDAIYLCAPLDASSTYRIEGRAADSRHWQSGTPAASGPIAPRYVIFEATTAYAGDSGSLSELSPAVRTNTGTLDSSKLVVQADGSFEILLAPERPAGHTGNFIPTRRAEHSAAYLVLRELYHDWEREVALDLHIERIESVGEHPAPLDPPGVARNMQTIGEIVGNQMRFWNEFYAVVLETYGDMNGDGKRFMPRNDLNTPSFAAIQTGGGQTTNAYAGGVFELDPDEALIVEARVPEPAAYEGFQLSNLWGESLDCANHPASLNRHQVDVDPDGVVRYVVAHRDPGVPNWLDTTGLREGFMAMRWTYSAKPEQMPTVAVSKVAFADVLTRLPATTRRVSLQERRAQIHARQRHFQRRYRQY